MAFAAAGLEVTADGGRPVIGIANSASELNPCNLPLRGLAGPVADGIRSAGGIPVEFGSISLGEDLMKPSAMLYRNLLAIEIEEIIRSNPLDGIVLLAGCDKTVPGAIMGAASADLAMVVVTSGAREPAVFRGRRIGSGSDLWRLWDERRAGRLDDAGWRELERCLGCAAGTCNTMGTASTMAILAETLGLMIPGSATIPAGDPRAAVAAAEAGRAAVHAVLAGRRPSAVLTAAAFGNAIRMLHAIGGSTNAVIHLAAMAGRVGVPLPLDDAGPAGRRGPGAGRRGALGPRAAARPGRGGWRAGPAPRAGRAGRPGRGHGDRDQHRPDRRIRTGGQRRDPVPGTGVGQKWFFRRGARVAGARRCGAEDLGRHRPGCSGTVGRPWSSTATTRCAAGSRTRRCRSPRAPCWCWPAAARSGCPGCRSGA